MISIAICAYNNAKKLAVALESLRDLTCPPGVSYEILVIDDGSQDETERKVATHGERVRYVFQDNAGPGAARNHGIRISTGAYLAFLDSDDVWLPTFLEKTVSALETHPQADLATTGIYVGPHERRSVGLLDGVTPGVWRLPTQGTRRQIPRLFHCCWSGAVVARRHVVERYGGFYERGCQLGEDVYLWIQVALNHWMYRICEPLAWYDTAASGLGFASGRPHYPMEPVLTDPEAIWRNCPPAYRTFLSSWLACHAVKSIHMQIAAGDHENARWLIEHYPAVRQWRSDWLRIRFKLAFPTLAGPVRKIKHALQR